MKKKDLYFTYWISRYCELLVIRGRAALCPLRLVKWQSKPPSLENMGKIVNTKDLNRALVPYLTRSSSFVSYPPPRASTQKA